MKTRPDAPINRRNWKDTRDYLDYCAAVRQCAPATVELYRVALDHLLRWTTAIPFGRAPDLRPTFPQYLDALSLSVAFTGKVLSTARAFFTWATANSGCCPAIKSSYIESLITRRREGKVKTAEAFSVEEIFALLDVPADSLIAQRDRAAVAMLFLSGMRDSAFCSIPLRAVDFDAYPPRLQQWPEFGVRTKFGKAANTVLLVEPSRLLEIARAWDATVRSALPDTSPWFALLEADGETFACNQQPGANRTFAKQLRQLCEKAGIPPRGPHKLRNAHIVYALQLCRDMGDLKAVSQNVMHNSITTTEAVYGRLREEDIAARLTNLGGGLAAPLFQPLQKHTTEHESG